MLVIFFCLLRNSDRVFIYIEKTEYLRDLKRVVRTDPIVRIPLLSVRDETKESPHILPLESDDTEALQKSPLYGTLVNADDDLSEVASSLLGPGPWSFHCDAKLPQSCKLVRFSNKNRKSNMQTTHILKFVMRVERGDDSIMDPKTGKRKLFDIVVQTPVQILSVSYWHVYALFSSLASELFSNPQCRCNPDWTSLPHYSKELQGNIMADLQCPCAMNNANQHANPSPLERIPTDSSGASAVEHSGTIPSNVASLRHIDLDSVVDRNTEYELLVSGQMTADGEMPPAYRATV